MKKIIALTDFSNNAYNALYQATRLVTGEACTFYILNVFNSFTPLRSQPVKKEPSQQLEDESSEGLEEVLHRIKRDDDDADHLFITLSKRGNLVDITAKVVASESIDLVVMGNSGRSEIEAILMGSNALDIISNVKKCPVLTVPKEVDFIPPKEIAFVTDFRHAYDAGLLQPLLYMARRFNSKIYVMHINEEEVLDKYQTMNRSVLMEYLLPFDHTFTWMPRFKNKANSINVFLEELQIDMLSMLNYEHSFLERMTREPVLKRVAFDINIPFLVIPYTD
ncbi:universal stress protein [Pareuzebyella sediminis]|uniref:universal stress protein n=1 Tax=Pareuzebyella sediminis TaxID=2607998 RepID=UPI0011EF4334|nr:universal stress protein [Pareuzebyella sediminis]